MVTVTITRQGLWSWDVCIQEDMLHYGPLATYGPLILVRWIATKWANRLDHGQIPPGEVRIVVATEDEESYEDS